jgi:bacteriocin-like protein
MEDTMTKTTKPSKAGAAKPAEQKRPATELNEKELDAVSGGQSCATGQHIPKVKIIT